MINSKCTEFWARVDLFDDRLIFCYPDDDFDDDDGEPDDPDDRTT